MSITVRTYKELEFYIQMFRDGNCDLLIIESRGGLGKSSSVDKVMEQARHLKVSAHVTPLQFFILGYEYKEDDLKDLENLEFLEGEIWIGKKDLLPHKLIVKPIVKDRNKANVAGSAQVTFLFRNYNQKFSIEYPTDFKKLAEIFSGF